MIEYVNGNLLESKAEALVNTVNCEGFMGKGIAYQFKLAFPENNKSYVEACRSGQLAIGTIHCFVENGKTIINFPTKDKWREKSRMEYIETGLNELIKLVEVKNLSSLAIPPLGSGNGGLIWTDVKNLIELRLKDISKSVEILIYEPSRSYTAKPTAEPKLSASALLLMKIKTYLNHFSAIRLQKTAYIMDVMLEDKYFNFVKHKYGPYDHAIDVISKNIKEFHKYHNTKDTAYAYEIAFNKLVSKNTEEKLNRLLPTAKKAADYVNKINSDKILECIATVLFIIQTGGSLSEEEIIQTFREWSDDKALRFNEDEIKNGISYLYESNLIEKNLVGFSQSDCAM